jgi:ATP-dependent RNA helicase DDX46/PRP5
LLTRPRVAACAAVPQDEGRRERKRGADSDSEGGARAKRRRSVSPAPAPPPAAPPAEEDEEAAAARRAEEQAKLDAEMERRRKRVEAWQEQRRRALAEEQGGGGDDAAGDAAAGGEGEDSMREESARGWTLDGDDDEEDDAGAAAAPPGADADAAGVDEAGGDAPGTQAPATQPPSLSATPADAGGGAMAVDGDDDVDPLDAFMAAQVMPEVARLRDEDASAYAVERAEYATADAAAAAAGVPPPLDGEVDPLDAFMASNDAAVAQQPLQPSQPPPPRSGAPVAGRPAVVLRPSGFKGLVVKGGAAAAGNGAAKPLAAAGSGAARGALRRAFGGGDSSSSSDDGEDSDSDDDADWARKTLAGKASKADKLGVVDHATIAYESFRKNFYIESAEIARLSDADVAAMRKVALEGVKCRGRDVPRPIRSWTQAGLGQKILDVLAKLGHERPLPIQAQALPVIMSGRDCIGIAKTGSGKTLAFLLPLLRHARDQPPLMQGEGPIGLIMAPTRELVTQIARDAKRFGGAVGLRACCVYGGSGVAAQISELKRGAEIVVATPGRLIDILATGNGRVTNLRRVTYLVLDEADRMFDMGFEPQISRIIQHTRPDRQTVMFSATFPHSMELLARSALNSPIEVQVGGRSVVNPDIEQYVEIRPEEERFLRLLELLGQWYEEGKILVFVHTQEKCDSVFRDLLRAGYPCLSLHGGKEQSDRECTIADFKSDVCNVLVATSVAARGLDVKSLRLVVNYDVPNHHEDYVHRCGRTGRAGAKGTAVTFIGPDEERYAPDLCKALRESGRPVPADLASLAELHAQKRRDGTAQAHGSGFGGSGFKFDAIEDGKSRAERKALAIEYGGEAAAALASSSDDEADEADEARKRQEAGAGIVQTRGAGATPAAAAMQAAQQAAAAAIAQLPPAGAMAAPPVAMSAAQQQAAGVTAAQAVAVAAFQAAAAAQANALALVLPGQAAAAAARTGFGAGALMPIGAASVGPGPACPPPPGSAAAFQQAAAAAALSGANATPAQRAAAFAASLNAARMGGAPMMMGAGADMGGLMATGPDHFEVEIEINDFPQHARWKVTHKDSLREITEFTGAAITAKGQFVPPGKPPGPGQRKLYLLVEGPTERSVREAKLKVREILEVRSFALCCFAARLRVLTCARSPQAASAAQPGAFAGAGGGNQGGRYSVV